MANDHDRSYHFAYNLTSYSTPFVPRTLLDIADVTRRDLCQVENCQANTLFVLAPQTKHTSSSALTHPPHNSCSQPSNLRHLASSANSTALLKPIRRQGAFYHKSHPDIFWTDSFGPKPASGKVRVQNMSPYESVSSNSAPAIPRITPKIKGDLDGLTAITSATQSPAVGG